MQQKRKYIRGSDKDVKCIVALYQDFDVKGIAHKQDSLPENKEVLLEFINNECPIKPSLLIWSGNGIHAEWLLDVPYVIEEDSSYISSVLKRWKSYLKSQTLEFHGWKFDSVADTARMLRAPGTTNFKTDEKHICEVIQYEDIRYSVEDFEEYVAKPKAKKVIATEEVDDFFFMGTGSSEELISKCQFLQYR